jgi:hypothetical protein
MIDYRLIEYDPWNRPVFMRIVLLAPKLEHTAAKSRETLVALVWSLRPDETWESNDQTGAIR